MIQHWGTVILLILGYSSSFTAAINRVRGLFAARQDGFDYDGGWAIRINGSCETGQADCGTRVNEFHACCPNGQVCDASGGNTACCPADTPDCYSSLVERFPKCADPAWTWCSNEGGFCCLESDICYTIPLVSGGSGDGCSPSGYILEDGETLASTVIPANKGPGGISATSASSATSKISITTSSLATSTSATTSPITTSSTPVAHHAISGGAIGGIAAGAVVLIMGVAALACICYRRGRASTSPPRYHNFQSEHAQPQALNQAYELPHEDSHAPRYELAYELSYKTSLVPVELPGTK